MKPSFSSSVGFSTEKWWAHQKNLDFLKQSGPGLARPSKKFLTDRHWAAARCLPTTDVINSPCFSTQTLSAHQHAVRPQASMKISSLLYLVKMTSRYTDTVVLQTPIEAKSACSTTKKWANKLRLGRRIRSRCQHVTVQGQTLNLP